MPAIEGTSSAQLPRLQLFGRFRLTQAGKDISLPGRKARAILAYLSLAADLAATREQLSYLMWTDRGSDQARASLRQSLKELRELAAIGTAVTTTRDEVKLDRTRLAIDLYEVGHAATSHDLDTLAGLLDEIRGDLLEDFLDVSPGFDDWLLAERPRQRELVLAQAVGAVEANGLADMKNARNILRSLDRIDPVNEAVVRLGMRLDHAGGDGASLHRRYRQLCDRLEREFQALPSEETRALLHALTSGTPQLAVTSVPAQPAAPARPAAGAEPQRLCGDMLPLVLVAPLQTHGEDGALASLAQFCADDMRTSISRIRGIQVLAVDGSEADAVVQQSEDALGLYLLSGSIHQVADDYRVTLQLANGQNRVIIWSDSLRFGSAGAEMLDTIVAKAAGATLPAIDRDLEARLRQSSEDLDDDRTIYTRARLLIRTSGHLEAVQEGVRLLEALAERDPQHLGARLLLIRMYNTAFWQQVCGHDVGHFRELSDGHLQAAAAIAPGHFEVRVRQAWCQLRSGETASARRSLEAALKTVSHDADLVNMCAMGLCHIGDLDEAERLMQQAFFLNPLPPSDYHADYAVILALRGDHETAEEHFAVSGEEGMQYAAVRIANATMLNGGASKTSQVAARLVADFHRAWQQERKPGLQDVLDWFGYAMPLNPPENLAWVRSGLQQTLEPIWPA
jgi:DNA-binding SARP family transcriptional activator